MCWREHGQKYRPVRTDQVAIGPRDELLFRMLAATAVMGGR